MVETPNQDQDHFLHSFLNPQSIAFYGASNDVLKNMGTAQLLNVIDNGYKGRIYPIHLRLEEVLNLKAYKKIGDLPETPDLVVVILPTRIIPQIFQEMKEKGVKHVILVTAGFREMDNGAGEEELKKFAWESGIRFMGPNVLGILNTHTHYDRSVDRTCILNCMWVNYRSKPGNVGMISQSGTFAAHIFMKCPELDLNLSYSLSIGNEANIDICDCLEFYERDPYTEVIILYIEELKRGRLFYQIAKRVSPKKPIIAIYAGGTEAGARAVNTHTGSMAGNDDIHNAMFKQCGIIRAYTLEELLDCAALFSKMIPQGAIPKGRKLGIITNAGGPGITMADKASRVHLEVPAFSTELAEKLVKYLPSTAKVANPLDYTFSINPAAFFLDVPKAIAKSGEVDAMVIYGAYGPNFVHTSSDFGAEVMGLPKNQQTIRIFREMSEAGIDGSKRLIKKYKIPIIYINLLSHEDTIYTYLNSRGFQCYTMPHRAIDALFHLIEYGEYLQNLENYN